MAWRARAHAKINLDLRVLGRRPDGFHELDTVFHAVDLADELVAERGEDGIRIEVTGVPVDPGRENLVHRAARAFLDASGVGGGLRVALHKRIPVGAGLGGGSSDAAAMLRLLQRLCGEPLADQAVHDLAVRLGADVAFFLAGGTQRGRGRGDVLTPLPHPQRHFLLILPPFGCETAAVYKNHRADLISGAQKASISGDKAVTSKGLAVPDPRRNDLEAAALRLHPELAGLWERIVDAGCPGLRMSGSGSALFLVTGDEAASLEMEGALGFLRSEGVRLIRTRSADPRDRKLDEVSWPSTARRGNQGG